MLATLGLGAILRTSEWVFLALKLVGAAYLIYLAVGLLRTRTAALALGGLVVAVAATRLFLDGAFSNISNPKIAVFYFAFLPQFVLPGAAHPTVCVFVLGLLFAGLTFLVKGPVGLCAGLLSGWLRSRPANAGLAVPVQRSRAPRARGETRHGAAPVKRPTTNSSGPAAKPHDGEEYAEAASV